MLRPTSKNSNTAAANSSISSLCPCIFCQHLLTLSIIMKLPCCVICFRCRQPMGDVHDRRVADPAHTVDWWWAVWIFSKIRFFRPVKCELVEPFKFWFFFCVCAKYAFSFCFTLHFSTMNIRSLPIFKVIMDLKRSPPPEKKKTF